MRQPEGFNAFLPKALPPDPPLRVDADLQALLSHADQALGRLDGAVQILPNPDLFVLMFVRREAVLSSQIEGTQSSLRDLLRAEANVAVKQASKFLGIGYAAANRLVDRMVERDILVEVTGNARNRRFACQRYIALFDD